MYVICCIFLFFNSYNCCLPSACLWCLSFEPNCHRNYFNFRIILITVNSELYSVVFNITIYAQHNTGYSKERQGFRTWKDATILASDTLPSVGPIIITSAETAKAGIWFIPLADEHGVCRLNCEIPWERMPYLSALEVCPRQGVIQIHVYLYL